MGVYEDHNHGNANMSECPACLAEDDAAKDRLDRWQDERVEPEVRTGEDEVVYADESEYV